MDSWQPSERPSAGNRQLSACLPNTSCKLKGAAFQSVHTEWGFFCFDLGLWGPWCDLHSCSASPYPQRLTHCSLLQLCMCCAWVAGVDESTVLLQATA